MASEPTSGLGMMTPKPEKAAPKKSESKDGEYPKITPPATYTPPDDAADGDTFDATVKFRKEGGQFCLLTIDGVPFKEDDEEAEKPATAPTMAEAASAQREMPGYAMM